MRSTICILLAIIIIITNIFLIYTNFEYKYGDFNLFMLSLNIATYILTVFIYRNSTLSKKKKEIFEISKKILESRDRYKMLLDKISEGVVLIVGQDNLCRYANEAFLKLLEINEKEIIGKPIVSFFNSNLPKTSTNIETQIQTKSGKTINIIIYSIPIWIQKEKEILISITDITKLKELEKALKESKQKAYTIFDSTNAAVIIINKKTHKIYKLNNAACKLIEQKREEIEGKECNSVICQYSFNECANKLEESNLFVKEEQLIKKNGTKIPILKSISKISIDGEIHIVETIIDISSRKKYEEEIFRNQKLESIGTLASGVAHEFNNINAIIKGTIEMIFMNDTNNEIPPNVKQQLTTIKKMIERSSILINDLLVFSDDSQNGYDIFRPIDLIDEIFEIISSDLKENQIQTNIKITKGTFVYANPTKIRNVFSNLISNAWHSMIESKKRELSLICSEIDNYIKFTVKDTGCGISEEELPKIFDPFFSKKGVYAEAGSAQSNFDSKGLGLSICQTIMENHHDGKIEIKSDIDIGTEVNILIPKATDKHIKQESLPRARSFLIAIFDQTLGIGKTCKKVLDLCDYLTIEIENTNELIGLVNDVDLIIIDWESIYQEEIFAFLSIQDKKTPIILLSDQKDIPLIHKKELGIIDVYYKPYLFKTIAWTIWDKLI